MNWTKLDVADFALAPGGRYKAEGSGSGQQYREDILEPAYDAGANLEIYLDTVVGLAPSFADEAFGGLVRSRGVEAARRMRFVAPGRPSRAVLAQRRVDFAAAKLAEGRK